MTHLAPATRPRRAVAALLLLVGLLPAAAPPSPARAPGGETTRAKAQQLLDRGHLEEAVAAFAELAEAAPDDPMAWFDLAGAHHVSGDYAAAHEAGERAASFPSIRATALYNMACASALQGHVDTAADELGQAIAAGFFDLDLMDTDGDLAVLREAGKLPTPPAQEYASLKHGRVTIPYVVLLPEGYDPARSYPAAVVFSPGSRGKRCTDLMIDTLFAEPAARGGRLLVCPVEPSNGWINHPSHHALNALMKDVRRAHRVDGERFDFVGFGRGARPALIYSGMSREFVASLLLIDGLPFTDWDDRELDELAHHGFPITLAVGASGHAEALRLAEHLRAADGDVTLDLVDTEAPLMTSLTSERLLARRESSGS